MHGPSILARTLSVPQVHDKRGNRWQYLSRSDNHSKVACWGVLFDLLLTCPLLQQHIADGKVTFGINHEMRDFRMNRKKNLDLVLCKPASGPRQRPFPELAREYGLIMTGEEWQHLGDLPRLESTPVGSVLVALEAKACMTEHKKARPRLYDELSSSFQTIHGDTSIAIAGAFVMINAAEEFVSPGKNPALANGVPVAINRHPKRWDAAFSVVSKIAELPRRSHDREPGFDGIGVVLIECQNDGSPVHVVDASPDGQRVPAILRYDTLVQRMAHLYTTRFNSL